MENALLIGLSRQMSLAREMDVLANNMANVNTTGFKARSTRFAEFISPTARAESFENRDKRVSFVIDRGTPIDLSAGAIERTGNPLDAAIKGEGYFVVQTSAGPRFTRDGAFEVNAKGEMVTQRGHRVLGENGPIVFSPGETGLRIAEDGNVLTDQGQRGKLRLVNFTSPRRLRNEGDNLLSAFETPKPAGPTTKIETAALERSNVRPVVEMTRLIEVQRAYQSIAGIIGRTDEIRRNAIQKLADVQS
jgi:flagellar basal-body rod protein FlgF